MTKFSETAIRSFSNLGNPVERQTTGKKGTEGLFFDQNQVQKPISIALITFVVKQWLRPGAQESTCRKPKRGRKWLKSNPPVLNGGFCNSRQTQRDPEAIAAMALPGERAPPGRF
jgi:hypothetical protein